MTIKIIVFDFDGTLVDSNRLKHDAFSEVFPADEHHARTVRSVLSDLNEQSRFVILAEILRRLGRTEGSGLRRESKNLADRYGAIVLEGAKRCAQMPGAGPMLEALASAYRMYVSSTTPQGPLEEIIRYRGWSACFADIFGYPHQKSVTQRRIMETENVNGKEVLVVGDGDSDRKSARENGCLFLHVDAKFDFHNFQNTIENIRHAKE